MTNPALREMLSQVFDLPVDAEEIEFAGVCVCEPVTGRVASISWVIACNAEGYIAQRFPRFDGVWGMQMLCLGA